MKDVTANIVVVLWAFVFGEIIDYIGSALENTTFNGTPVGITAAIVAFIAVNGIYLVSKGSYSKSKSN